ncbi:MAG: carboxymuconolactone decarboxylase family protein [Solirubrobacterales bacterium]
MSDAAATGGQGGGEARIAPLEPPYDPQTEAMLAKWMPPGSGVEPLALFRTLGRHEELASRSRPLGAGILAKGLVPPRLREVMIHRTCALTGAEYEWGVHVMGFGRPLGFTDGQLASTISGSAEDPVWEPGEAAVFAMADALHHESTIDDELLERLREHLDDEQIIELCLTSGWYHAISYVINVAAIPLEPWAARFGDLETTAG